METLTQGQNFTDTAGRTGVVNFDVNTGQRLGEGQTTSLKPATMPNNAPATMPATITSDSLKPVTPFTLPPQTTPTYGGLEGALAGTVATNKANQASAEQTRIEELRKKDESNVAEYMKALTDSGAISSSVDRTEQDKLKSQVDEYTNQIEAEDLALRRQLENVRKNFQGTTGGLQAEENRLTRDSLSKQADLAMLQAGVARRYDIAAAIADRKVAMKMEESRVNIESKKFFLERNGDQLDKLEKTQLDRQIREEQREYEKEYKKEEQNNAMLLNAIQGNAPQSVISKAQQLINSGASTNEVAKALGNYSMSASDRLDLRLKQAQLNKISSELRQTNPDAGELVKINGQDYIRYKDGTISNPVLPGASDIKLVVSRNAEKIKTLDRLVSSGAGLRSSTGQLRLKTPVNASRVNDWRADAMNIISKLTVDELGRVKSDGVTFGALSNGEREAVGAAASSLSAASIKDKEGNPTGKFRMSQQKVQEEFTKIQNAYKLDFERRLGVPYETYVQNPQILEQKAADDFVNSVAPQLAEEQNYGGYPTN